MSPVALAFLLLAFCLIAAIFALIKGGTAERLGAVIILANLILGLANELRAQSQLVTLIIDGATALGLLIVALRYASLWLGVVMLLYGLQFALHAYYFVLEKRRDGLHIALNNLDFFAVSLCLVAGTAVAWRRRDQIRSAASLGS